MLSIRFSTGRNRVSAPRRTCLSVSGLFVGLCFSSGTKDILPYDDQVYRRKVGRRGRKRVGTSRLPLTSFLEHKGAISNFVSHGTIGSPRTVHLKVLEVRARVR